MRDEPGAEHRVERGVPQRQPGHIGEQQPTAPVASGPYRRLEHRRGEIRTQNRALWPDGAAQCRQGASRTASCVDHGVAGAQPECCDGGRIGGSVVGEAGVPVRGTGGEELLDMCVVIGHTDMIPQRPPERNGAKPRESVCMFEHCAIVLGHFSVIFRQLSKCAPGVRPHRD